MKNTGRIQKPWWTNCIPWVNITPPVGSVLFVGCGIGHVSIEQVTSKLIPYFVALVAALLAVTYIPALSLGLPSLMGLI